MRTRFARFVLTLVACFAAGVLPAQIPGFDGGLAGGGDKVAVEIAVEPATARPGELVTVRAKLDVLAGWHIYGFLQSPDMGSPTEFTLDKHEGVEPFGPAWIPAGTPHGEDDLMTHHLYGGVELTRRVFVPADAAPGAVELGGQLIYMVCDESSCDPVAEAPWKAKLTIEAGDARPQFARKKVELLGARVRSGARAGESVDVAIELWVQPGWHIYGKEIETGVPTRLEVLDAAALTKLGVSAGQGYVPVGEEHYLEALEEMSYHLTGKVTLYQRFVVAMDAKPESVVPVRGTVEYQVCDESSCDNATKLTWSAELAIEKGEARAQRIGAAFASPLGAIDGKGVDGKGVDGKGVDGKGVDAGAEKGADGKSGGKEAGIVVSGSGDLADKTLWEVILLAIGGALFALVMPCTYPMIPITISFFTKQADARGGNVLPLALTYGAGIIGIFVLIGLVFGQVIVPFAQHWVTNVVIGAFFLVFALSLLGLFTLNPPKFLMNAAGKASTKGGYAGVFLMGATLVVTSFTCTAPFVGNVLAIGAKGGYGMVAFAMAVFGLTMAIPFVFLALAPGAMSAMPSSGMWMNTLKVFLGFVEVAAALKFFSNADLTLGFEAMPRETFLFLWAAIFFVAGYYLLGRIRFKGETGEIGPGRLVAALLVILFGTYCASGAMGNKLDWITEAIAPQYESRMQYESAGGHVSKAGSKGLSGPVIVKDDYDEAHRLAKAEGRLLFLNFTGWT